MEKIFKWFTYDADLSPAYTSWFVESYECENFYGLDKLFYLFLEYCEFLGVIATKKNLESFLMLDGRKYVKQHNIRLETMGAFDYDEPASFDEAFRIIANTMLTQYDLYVSVDISETSFKVSMYEYLQEKKKDLLIKNMTDNFSKLTSEQDTESVISNMQLCLSELQNAYDVKRLDRLDFLTKEKVTSTKDSDGMRFLFKTGTPCIDGDVGGMYSKMVWSFSGPPGSGKSRFGFIKGAYQAAVVDKIGVRIDSLELTKREVENILIAFHLINLFSGTVKIPDKIMNSNEMSDEQKRYYNAAKMDLFESGKYGRIVIVEDKMYVQTMGHELRTFFKRNTDIQLEVIDYAGLWKQKKLSKFDPNMTKSDLIYEGYEVMKDLAKDADIGVWILNQFTSEGEQKSSKGLPLAYGDIQGGQATSRWSDYAIIMTMTQEQEIASLRCMTTLKKRSASGFFNVPFQVDLAVSIFRQLNKVAQS